VPVDNNLHLCVLQFYHNLVLSKISGQNKILELIQYSYVWLNIHTNVQQFCKSYVTCMQSKSQCYKPYRLLKQFSISECLWNLISINFIEKLSFSSGFNTISVIVDQLSKQAIFISTYDTIILAELACLFVIHVFLKYGVSSHVILD